MASTRFLRSAAAMVGRSPMADGPLLRTVHGRPPPADLLVCGRAAAGSAFAHLGNGVRWAHGVGDKDRLEPALAAVDPCWPLGRSDCPVVRTRGQPRRTFGAAGTPGDRQPLGSPRPACDRHVGPTPEVARSRSRGPQGGRRRRSPAARTASTRVARVVASRLRRRPFRGRRGGRRWSAHPRDS